NGRTGGLLLELGGRLQGRQELRRVHLGGSPGQIQGGQDREPQGVLQGEVGPGDWDGRSVPGQAGDQGRQPRPDRASRKEGTGAGVLLAHCAHQTAAGSRRQPVAASTFRTASPGSVDPSVGAGFRASGPAGLDRPVHVVLPLPVTFSTRFNGDRPGRAPGSTVTSNSRTTPSVPNMKLAGVLAN